MKKAKDLMSMDSTVLRGEDSLGTAANLFINKKVSGVPVVDNNDNVIGFISERDILSRLLPRIFQQDEYDIINLSNLKPIIERLSPLKDILVKECMTEPVASISGDTLEFDIYEMMLKNKIKRVPVLMNKKLIGIVDQRDLVRSLFEK